MSCSDVCLDMDYDVDNEFYAEVTYTARKPYHCCECRETIVPGQRYERATGKADDHIWTVKTCAHCAAIRKALVCGSWQFGKLWEQIEENVFPVWLTHSPIDCLAQIDSLEARNKLRERFDEWQAETR